MGLINLAGRPRVYSGGRDIAALAFGISGFVVAGPMELFLPERAAFLFGPGVWLFLIAFYVLSVTLIILLMRPRIMVYNAGLGEIERALESVGKQLETPLHHVADCVVFPSLGVQLHVESFTSMRLVQLISAGSNQDHVGWRQLRQRLATELRPTRSPANPQGFVLIAMAMITQALLSYQLIINYQSVVPALAEMLRL